MPAKKETLTEEERSRRIKEMAVQLETDESPEAFDRAFNKVIKNPSTEVQVVHTDDVRSDLDRDD
jgi:hypothetical protein